MTKQPKTIQEMMTLLVEERGLDITGFSEFSTVLLDCNYYRLSGYFRAFQIDPSMAIIAFEMERTLRIS